MLDCYLHKSQDFGYVSINNWLNFNNKWDTMDKFGKFGKIKFYHFKNLDKTWKRNIDKSWW